MTTQLLSAEEKQKNLIANAPQILKRLRDASESYKRRGYQQYAMQCNDAIELIEALQKVEGKVD